MSSISFATREGIQSYLQDLTLEEVNDIASRLEVTLSELPGEGIEEKTRELIAYLDRRHKLPELYLTVMKVHVEKRLKQNEQVDDKAPKLTNAVTQDNLSALSIQLASLQEQVSEIRRNSPDELKNKLDEVVRTADTARKLTADVVLPPPEMMAVNLVPLHQFKRLEEYHSDENFAYLFTGTFLGAVIGIFSNWATSEDYIFTKSSIILMFFLILLTIGTVIWTIRVKRRADGVIKDLFAGKK